MIAVSLRDVTIRYGDFEAVANVSADFPAGAVGLLGRNGAGKTSILKALLGLVRPSSGTLQITGVPDGATAIELRRHVGYMPEKDCFVPGLNGFETVRLAAELSGLPGREASRRAHEVLWLCDLGEQRYREVSGYSAGMRQKVKLATALVHDPTTLFLDEPTNGLDPDGRREMLELVEGLASSLGKSIVLSSHILPDVERVCRDVVVIDRGRVVASGPVAELTRAATRVFDLETSPIDALGDALRRAGALDVTDNARGGLAVTLPESVPTRDVFRAVAEAGGEVRRLVERRRTLAEVFLGAVRADEAVTGAERGAV
jgi:ABC-2 type transport system ATP-binding protein